MPYTETVEPLPPDKLQLFRKRFEEGYNIPDPEYDQWLNQTHPEIAFPTLELPDYTFLDDGNILQPETPCPSPVFSEPLFYSGPIRVPLSACGVVVSTIFDLLVFYFNVTCVCFSTICSSHAVV